jgi:GT2 family glycosyltransferase
MNFEIVVVDNNSPDDSAEMLLEQAKIHENLHPIISKENLGFGKGNNLGVANANGTYVLLLNSDIIVLDDAINELYTYFIQNQDKMAFVGGKLLNKDRTPQPSAGPFQTLPVVFAWLFLQGDKWGISRSSPDKETASDWISGACIMTTRKMYTELSGFDEKIFMYMEEVDLLYRAKKQGFSTCFYPKSQFIHLEGASSTQKRTDPILNVYKGLIYFYRKHFDPFSVFLLKCMLQLKSLIALMVGKITGNSYLINTYGKALKIASMD